LRSASPEERDRIAEGRRKLVELDRLTRGRRRAARRRQLGARDLAGEHHDLGGRAGYGQPQLGGRNDRGMGRSWGQQIGQPGRLLSNTRRWRVAGDGHRRLPRIASGERCTARAGTLISSAERSWASSNQRRCCQLSSSPAGREIRPRAELDHGGAGWIGPRRRTCRPGRPRRRKERLALGVDTGCLLRRPGAF